MINVTVTGPMVRLEEHESKNGSRYYEMVLAHISRNGGVVRKDYVTCIAFSRLVNYHLLPKISPGELVTVIGPLEVSAYIPQNGTEPRARLRVVADRVELHWDAPKKPAPATTAATDTAATADTAAPAELPTVATEPVEVDLSDDAALLEEIMA